MKNALGKILKPLIRLALRAGIDFGEFVTVSRRLFVEVAQEREFALADRRGGLRRPSASRLAVLTGINRKEIKRLMEKGGASSQVEQANTNRAVRAIGGWMRDERFVDGGGEPRALSFGTKAEGEGRFEDLVKAYSGDLTARVVLDELIRVGAVAKGDDGLLRLVEKAYVPVNSGDELLELGATSISDLIETVKYNLFKPEEERTRLQLMVAYDDVPQQGVTMFRSIIRSEGAEFLERNDRLLSSLDRTQNPDLDGDGRFRIGVGLYYFQEDLHD